MNKPAIRGAPGTRQDRPAGVAGYLTGLNNDAGGDEVADYPDHQQHCVPYLPVFLMMLKRTYYQEAEDNP